MTVFARLIIPTLAGPHTPEPGSLERQEICNAARAFVLSKYTNNQPLPQAIVFKIEHILVQNPYCNFEAIPLFKDGSNISTDYIEDIAFNFCLKKAAGRWDVIIDLSRTDVPDNAERQMIRNSFPDDFPMSLLSTSWRKILGEPSSTEDSDPIWGPGGYVAHLEQVVGHEGRGAAAEDVRQATAELDWLQANEAHLRKLMQYLKENNELAQPKEQQ